MSDERFLSSFSCLLFGIAFTATKGATDATMARLQRITWVACALVALSSSITSADLAPRAFQPLPVGSVTPKGWLLAQLKLQAHGLSGHLSQVGSLNRVHTPHKGVRLSCCHDWWSPVVTRMGRHCHHTHRTRLFTTHDAILVPPAFNHTHIPPSQFWNDIQHSSWIGGGGDGGLHERTPYWLNGIVPLAFLLDNAGEDTMPTARGIYHHKHSHSDPPPAGPTPTMMEQTEKYVEYILGHRNASTGWLGPPVNQKDGNTVRRRPAGCVVVCLCVGDMGSSRRWVGGILRDCSQLAALLSHPHPYLPPPTPFLGRFNP